MTGVREQKRRAWRAVALRLAALGLLLLMLPFTSCVCCPDDYAVRIDGWPTLGAVLPSYIEPVMFANEYTEHVRAADGTGGELLAWQDKRYAKNATIPDINATRARMRLPAAEDVTTENCPLRKMRVELNVRWFTDIGRQFEGSLFERVSPEGYMPIFRMVVPAGPQGDEAVSREPGPPAEYPVEYHHTISIGLDQLLLTFELWGTDPQTGQPAGERHTVRFRSFALFGLDGSDAENQVVGTPHFLVTSHTIEALPADETAMRVKRVRPAKFVGVIESVRGADEAASPERQRLVAKITEVLDAGDSGVKVGDQIEITSSTHPYWCVDERNPPLEVLVSFWAFRFELHTYRPARFDEAAMRGKHVFLFTGAARPRRSDLFTLLGKRVWGNERCAESVLGVAPLLSSRSWKVEHRFALDIAVSRTITGAEGYSESGGGLHLGPVSLRSTTRNIANEPRTYRVICHGPLDPNSVFVGDLTIDTE